jgi:hypothetical protein
MTTRMTNSCCSRLLVPFLLANHNSDGQACSRYCVPFNLLRLRLLLVFSILTLCFFCLLAVVQLSFLCLIKCQPRVAGRCKSRFAIRYVCPRSSRSFASFGRECGLPKPPRHVVRPRLLPPNGSRTLSHTYQEKDETRANIVSNNKTTLPPYNCSIYILAISLSVRSIIFYSLVRLSTPAP